MMALPDEFWTPAPFDAFDASDRVALESIGVRRNFKAGDSVFRPGDVSFGAYAVVDGTVSLEDASNATLDGRAPSRLDVPGTLFSKGSLLEPFHHRHHCRAVTDATVLLIPRDAFEARFVAGERFALTVVDAIVRATGAEIRELNAAIHAFVRQS
ncbi:MAG: Crp/Fnr family transcriptional regulator [Myxococcales bacterium]|nr:Crp/Fnr family transcriptional regulator [Myxococcales bacterium]MCB9531261.1 Crp/Fnr family transcriptional regulator [Myxococcales bacterium]